MSAAETIRITSGPRPLDGLLQRPGRAGDHPLVVVCHGFKGFMEWGFFQPLADLLVDRGLAVLRFNFSGGGMAPGDDLVTDVDAFRDNTFSKELDDLLVVLAAARDGRVTGRPVAPQRLGLVGHSRGGGIAVLAAASPGVELGALVTWAAVSTFDRASDEEKRAWRAAGEMEIVNGRTGQKLPLGVGLLDDVEQNRERLDVPAAAGRVRAPWRIVHGSDDETVPFAEAEALWRASGEGEGVEGGRADLVRIDGGGHTFGATHPFRGPTPGVVGVFNGTQEWLCRYLRVGDR